MTHSETGAKGPGGGLLAFIKGHKKITAAILIFAGLSVFRLLSGPTASPRGGFGADAVYVELSNADYGAIRELGLYYGTLSAPSRFSLAPKVGGELREILVDIGDRLESGQVVALLDDDEFRLARDRAYLAVTLAQAQMAEASANLQLARNDMTRQESLSRKSVVAASELEASENRLLQAEARLGVAESQLASARNQLADAELRLSYTRVTAAWTAEPSGPEAAGPPPPASESVAALAIPTVQVPAQTPMPGGSDADAADYAAVADAALAAAAAFEAESRREPANAPSESSAQAHAGYRYVGARLADTGALVAANTPILDIVSLDPLLVVVDVIEKDYPRITVGMVASVRAEAFPGETFRATVKRVAPVLSATSRQARVELEVPNPGLMLKPGMYAEAVFTFARREGVWSVASDVPYRKYDGYVIFIADPVTGTVEERRVELGIREGDRVELLGAGSIDGPVVVMGQHLLRDGQAYRLPDAEPVPASRIAPSSGRGNPGAGLSAS
ncbi:MAG: efflux RND transporter periplasmic adaptor subunit [Deltaproteobacteria bacterium]|jgi:multidrug efflux pump subunit AcrA (membrane-fusion protein)|nr:efflux RND transporter periplasmic adaptor subunit [Deltaproteobacteria bacterium]